MVKHDIIPALESISKAVKLVHF